MQILPHFLQNCGHWLRALLRRAVDQTAEDRRHERRRVQITAQPAAVLPGQGQKRAHLRGHRTVDRQRRGCPPLRLRQKRLIVRIRRCAVKMEPEDVPLSRVRRSIIVLRRTAVDPEKAPGGKPVGFAAIFQYSGPGKRQLDKIRIQLLSDGIVICTRNEMPGLLQIQQLVAGKRARRDDLPFGLRRHIEIVVQHFHSAVLRKTARY